MRRPVGRIVQVRQPEYISGTDSEDLHGMIIHCVSAYPCLKCKELSNFPVKIQKFRLAHQTLDRKHPLVLQLSTKKIYLTANEYCTIEFPKSSYFSSNIFPPRNTAFSEPLFCINIQRLYIYTFSLSPYNPENRPSPPLVHNRRPPCEQVPRRMFTTYWSGCEQPPKRM